MIRMIINNLDLLTDKELEEVKITLSEQLDLDFEIEHLKGALQEEKND